MDEFNVAEASGGEQEPEAPAGFTFEEVLELDEVRRALVAIKLAQTVAIREKATHPEKPERDIHLRNASIEYDLSRDGHYERLYPHYVMKRLAHLGVTEDMFPVSIDPPWISTSASYLREEA